MRLIGIKQILHEGPATVIDTMPANIKGAFPVCAAILAGHGATATYAGIVEQEVNSLTMLGNHLITKAQYVRLARDITFMQGDSCFSVRPRSGFAESLGFLEVVHEKITGCNPAPSLDQLDAKLAPHARTATGNNGDLALEVIHR